MNELSPEVRDVLREAKGLVAAGWFKLGSSCDFAGAETRHCVMSAVLFAARIVEGLPPSATDTRSYAPIERLLKRATGAPSMFKWNDAPERTHAQVVALFDKVLTGDTPPLPDPEDSRELVAA